MWEPLSDLSGSEHNHPLSGEFSFIVVSSAFLHFPFVPSVLSQACFKNRFLF